MLDVGSGAPVTPAMRFHATNIGVAFSPDGRRLVSAAGRVGARVWDLPGGEPLTPPLEEDMPLHFATYAPGGETFAVGGGTEFGRAGAARIRNADGEPRTDLLRHGVDPHARLRSAPTARGSSPSSEEHGPNVKVWDAAIGTSLLGSQPR